MSKDTTAKLSLRQERQTSPVFPILLNLFDRIGADANAAADFAADFEIQSLQLGDELRLPSMSEGDRPSEDPTDSAAYVICQGRVRLLGFDSQRQRDISAKVLEVEDWCGGDEWFAVLDGGSPVVPYRAVAASDARVARISYSKLQPWLGRLPSLQTHLQDDIRRRQCQLFFKTLTEARSLPAHQIEQLLPYLAEARLDAGTPLAAATPSESGRFWLRGGRIECEVGEDANLEPDEPKAPNTAGVGWGYPQSIPNGWVARSDVWIYHLPVDAWEEVKAIAPILTGTPESDTQAAKNGHSPPKAPRRRLAATIAPAPAATEENAKTTQQTQKAKEKAPIVFPKPIGRRVMDLLARYPFVQQQSSSDCGAACLAAIGQYWGKRFSINFIRELAGVGRSGASLKGLAKAAESLGFQARPVRASLSKLAESSNPWVAHWQGIHYVVIYKVTSRRVLVADPAKGKQWVSRKEMLENWSGYALLLDPTDRLKAAETEQRSLGKFAVALWPYRNLGLQIIAVSILLQLFALVNPLFTQIILDQVVVQKSQNALTVFCLGALLFGLGNMAMSGVRKYLLAYLSNRLSLTLVTGFISHALSLPLKFFESRRVGDITTRVSENQKIQRFLISQVLLAWLNFVTGIVYLGLMLYYNARLTMLVLALIPPMVIFTLIATPFLRKLSRERFNAAADQNSAMVEMLTGVPTVKAAAAERELRWRWEDLFTHQLNVRFKGQKLGISLEIISGLINSLGGIALLWYGASLVINGDLTIGQFVAFNMMKGKVLSPVMALTHLWDELQEVWISVERLNDVFATEPEEVPGNRLLVLPRLRGDVRFDKVTFRYSEDEDRNTLQNISFEARPGQTIAIVGRSGSGKTTLVKLLQGLYHPTNGRITIDGHDLQHVSPQSLRSQLGVVPQDCYLFSGTISENITLYTEDVSLDRVIEAAKLAEAHAFIQDMPLGYNTKVGERGSSLSGGQQQRISIARALLGEPRILVLDEATSSLDTESERRFQQNLERISRDRTTFIIAHRLSTVRNADLILVLDRGLLVEQGNHEQLMTQEGLYYHLAQQQLDL